MRVSGVDFRNHPGIGSLRLDFRDELGAAARTVVLAGENGCGKTSVLEAIYQIVNSNAMIVNNKDSTKLRNCIVLVEASTLGVDVNNYTQRAYFDDRMKAHADYVMREWPGFAGLAIEVYGVVVLGRPACIVYNALDDTCTHPVLDASAMLGKQDRVLFNKAISSFQIPIIQTASATATYNRNDPGNSKGYKVEHSLPGEIAQLLVNLSYEDSKDVQDWLERHPEGRPPKSVTHARVARFSNAFARLDPHKRFKKVKTEDGVLKSIFSDGVYETELTNLSAGEQQVVFRGAFLLQKSDLLTNAVVLIDEPEISLHPQWQSKVLSFYKHVVDVSPDHHNQIIVSTHSPFVVHGSPLAKHIILSKDPETRVVQVRQKTAFPGVTLAEMAVNAFSLESFARESLGKKTILLVEGDTDRGLIELAWTKLHKDADRPFVVRGCGGAKSLQQLIRTPNGRGNGPLLDAVGADLGPDRVVGLFDFDGEGYSQWNGTVSSSDADRKSEDEATGAWRKRIDALVWVMLLPVPSYRRTYAGLTEGYRSSSILTIEHLFQDEFIAPLMTRVPIAGTNNGETKLHANNAQKQAIVASACDWPPSAFKAFEQIFNFIKSIQ